MLLPDHRPTPMQRFQYAVVRCTGAMRALTQALNHQREEPNAHPPEPE